MVYQVPRPSLSPGACSNSSPLNLMMLSNHFILHHPLSSCLQSFPASGFFSNESALLRIKWPKYWSFSISPSNEYSGLISFRIDLSNLLAVQGTLKSLPQHHNLKASVLQNSGFFNGPTLTSIHDYWKNHSVDYMDLCW